MIVKIISSDWLKRAGNRIDAGPHTSGAIEFREVINSIENNRLNDCLNSDGIRISPYFKRIYVKGIENGKYMLGNTNILDFKLTGRADILSMRVISQYDDALYFKKGDIIVTCFGTVGNLAYYRESMSDMVASTNFMRISTNEGALPSGYLFAYMNTVFGKVILTQNETGSVIPSLLPEQIEDYNVPRFGHMFETEVDQRIKASSELRDKSNSLFKKAGRLINEKLNFPEYLALTHREFNTTSVSSLFVSRRMDATYHDQIAQMSDDFVEQAGAEKTLAELGVNTGESGRMKLIFTESDHGVPFSTSGEIFRARYEPKRFLAKSKLGDVADWGVRQEDILLARSGQVGGIIGTGVWADSRFENAAVSVDVIRIKAQESEVLPGYLYSYLMCTDVGYRQLIRSAAGSSIPHLSSDDVLKLKLPRMGALEEKAVHELVQKAGELAAEAQKLEDEAVKMVEDAIDAAAPKH